MFTTTIPLTLDAFYHEYLRQLGEHHEVHVVSSAGSELDNVVDRASVQARAITMTREISPVRDISAFLSWLFLLARLRPKVVVSATPKASMLSLLAARVLGVPERIYIMGGLRLEGSTGFRRAVLAASEKLTFRSATRAVANSASLRERVLELGLCPPDRLEMTEPGSTHGVDAAHYSPQEPDADLTAQLGIDGESIVVGFVGRLTRDKGIDTLIEAARTLQGSGRRLHWLVVGSQIESDSAVYAARLEALDVDLTLVPGTDDVRPYFALMDIHILPSLREGFPNVVLEASAMGKPTVTTDATGCVDSVIDGRTGFVVPAMDAAALAEAVGWLADDPALRERHGAAARDWVSREFVPKHVVASALGVHSTDSGSLLGHDSGCLGSARRQNSEPVLVIVEQRCRLNEGGDLLGAVRLGALEGLTQQVPVNALAREGTAPQSTVVLHGSKGTLVPWSSLSRVAAALWMLQREVRRASAVVVYAPGSIGTVAGLLALVLRRPLAVVAVGDPTEALRPPVTHGVAGRVARALLPWAMRAICARAEVVRYVTERVLQEKYPAGSTTVAGSDARPMRGTDDRRTAMQARLARPARTVVTVASLDQPYKGVSELITAVGLVQARGIEVRLVVVGDGRLRPSLESEAQQGLRPGSVHFSGHLTQEELSAVLSASDLFVLSSWSEGTPRALIEAMEAGLPCIGTAVGGVVELLPDDALVQPRKPKALADAIGRALTDDSWRARSAEANATRAAEVFAVGAKGHDEFLRFVVRLSTTR